MKNLKYFFAMIVIVCSTLFGSVLPSQAYEITEKNFDYVTYADTYPDLKNAYGYDAGALFRHYRKHGRTEGRIGLINRASFLSRSNFDAVRYANEYPDLKNAFGNDKNALYNHYVNYGVKEGRLAWSTDVHVNAQLVAADLAKATTISCKTDREKIKYIHDWLIVHTAYNMETYQSGNYLPTDYKPAGPLVTGKAICSGYAEAFDLCMEMLGIPCKIVSSTSHAWNEVYVEGQWRSIDCCWDDPVPDRAGVVYRYTYFLIPPEQMNKVEHHQPAEYR